VALSYGSQYRDSKLGYAASVTLIILVIGVERLGGDPNQRAMPAIRGCSPQSE
jgi:hypothetical protein